MLPRLALPIWVSDPKTETVSARVSPPARPSCPSGLSPLSPLYVLVDGRRGQWLSRHGVRVWVPAPERPVVVDVPAAPAPAHECADCGTTRLSCRAERCQRCHRRALRRAARHCTGCGWKLPRPMPAGKRLCRDCIRLQRLAARTAPPRRRRTSGSRRPVFCEWDGCLLAYEGETCPACLAAAQRSATTEVA